MSVLLNFNLSNLIYLISILIEFEIVINYRFLANRLKSVLLYLEGYSINSIEIF